jgi:putative ABC transport system permease protein
LAEAVSVSVTGALVGVVVGVLSVEALKHPLQTAPQYQMLILSIVGGLLFGVVLGVSAGLIPAKQASDLDSAQAMRFE